MIASTQWLANGQHRVFYVAQLAGDGGTDWGYTTEHAKAIPLSTYWQRRFQADQVRCGRRASFL